VAGVLKKTPACVAGLGTIRRYMDLISIIYLRSKLYSGLHGAF